jgi:MFS family permease
MMVHQAAVIGMMLMVMGGLFAVASMSWGYNLVLLLLSFACVSGVGMAVCFTTLTVLSIQKVPDTQHGLATGLCTTLYFLGGGLGLWILSLVMDTSSIGNQITQLPVVVLMMFAITGVAGLLYFGGRSPAEENSPASPGVL